MTRSAGSFDEITKGSLQEFLDSNPAKYDLSDAVPSSFPTLPRTIAFYDKHLAENISLKQVTVLPSLPGRLNRHLEHYLLELEEQPTPLPSTTGQHGRFPNKRFRASRFREGIYPVSFHVQDRYNFETGFYAGTFATTIHFHPSLHAWQSVFRLKPLKNDDDIEYPFLTDSYCLQLCNADQMRDAWKDLPSSLQKRLLKSRTHSPSLAIFQVYDDSLVSKDILEKMDKYLSIPDTPTPTNQLPWCTESVEPIYTGDTYNSSLANALISDHDDAFNAAPSNTESDTRPRNTSQKFQKKRATRQHKVLLGHSRFNPVALRHVDGPTNIPEDELVPILLRRAWTRAVAANCTFIVFHSGSYERIGLRDRETQTLFLSPLINVWNSTPANHSIHSGLYLACLDDAFQRVPRHISLPSHGFASRVTRSRTHREEEQKLLRKTVIPEIQNREVLLMVANYHCYCSPAPALFVRSEPGSQVSSFSGRTVGATDYCLLTLTSELAKGGTGIVHKATLGIQVSEAVQSIDCVAKIAFSPIQCKRLSREFTIYKKLLEASIKGVPRAYGLFRDTTTGALMLVMGDAGQSLYSLYPERFYHETNGNWVLPPDQREAYERILSDIHNAGIVHRDMRPQNLMMDAYGNVYIVDFDRAHLDPTDEAKNEEHQCLLNIFRGLKPKPMSASEFGEYSEENSSAYSPLAEAGSPGNVS